MTKNTIRRGVNQALYKYLPHIWTSFDKKGQNYTVQIKYWNSELIRGKHINEKRIIENIDKELSEYKNFNNVEGFIFPLSVENSDLRTLVPRDNSSIISEISPLTFFCGKCYKIHSYRQYSDYFVKNPKNSCSDKKCKGKLNQLNFVYVCECGWGKEITPKRCKTHGYNYVFLDRYNQKRFICRAKGCNKRMEMYAKCEDCGKIVYPRNSQDNRNYIPKTLTMIDLLDREINDSLDQNKQAGKLILSQWINDIEYNELLELLKIKDTKDSNQAIEELVELFMKTASIPEELARKLAMSQYKNQNGDSIKYNEMLNEIELALDNSILQDVINIKDLAIQIMEFNTASNYGEIGDGRAKSLEEAYETAKELNTNTNNNLDYIKEKFKIKNVILNDSIPFVFTSYGYNRREIDPFKAKVRAFPPEVNNRNTFYINSLKTEGILFELDRKKIIEWLLNNNIIDEIKDNVPDDLNNEKELKLWFINKIKTNEINRFSGIDKDSKITYYVYTLIHSISHSFMKQASVICGLDKNSISEYIFPNLTSFLIYVSNSQGTNIGALSNMFDAYFDKWLEYSLEDIEKCIFDPVCIDEDKACSGCLFTNEISCQHFNKDLDRSLLIGYYDYETNKRFIGYWEE